MNPETFPKAMPKITYDLGVGGLVQNIDFDYNQFYDMARTAGMTNKQINRLNIHFSSDKPVANNIGRHNKRTTTILVEPLASHQLSSDISDIVIHETGHYVDYLRGRYALYTSINAALTAGSAISMLGGIANITEIIKPWNLSGILQNVSAMTDNPRVLASLPLILGSGILRDINNGLFSNKDRKKCMQEKPAYAFQAANQATYKVASLEPKSKLIYDHKVELARDTFRDLAEQAKTHLQ